MWQTLDHPLWADFNAHATQSLSEIVLDDITADNTFQMEEHVEVTRQGYGGPHKKVKSELKFSDFLGLVEITPEDGYPVLENVECVGEFASLFRADYDRMKPEGTDINTFLEGYLVSGEYDHTVYDPVKDFISGLLDITIIKPIIECFTGEDLITGATLSDLERALKLGGAIVDLFTLGQAMVLTKGAGLGAKAIGKTVILELASNAAVYSVGYSCDALGMPVVASWGLSILTGCTVSAVGGKYLFKDSSGNVIKECTSLEAEQILKKGSELDGNIKSYADWMLPKDAEVFLQYKATGSLDGLSEADIKSIRKLEELIELKQVEYQDIFNIRNRDEVLARNSKVHRVEDVAGGGSSTLENISEPIAAGPSLVQPGEGYNLKEAATKISPIEGYTDVVIHGTPDSFGVWHNGKWEYIDQRSLTNFLKNNPEYKGGPVRLISCSTGAKSDGIAQQLANKLGVEVMAPSDTLYIYPNGSTVIGPNPYTNSGSWESFKPGKW